MLTLYWRSAPYCAYCEKAKLWLANNNIPYEGIDVATNAEALAFLKAQGHRSIPQIYDGADVAVPNGSDGLAALTPEEIVTLRQRAQSLKA